MTDIARRSGADHGQRRASFQQARSHETKRSLVQAAMALWRANGYPRVTVAGICRDAGV
jgi:AcrR family transcriptional regulator